MKVFQYFENIRIKLLSIRCTLTYIGDFVHSQDGKWILVGISLGGVFLYTLYNKKCLKHLRIRPPVAENRSLLKMTTSSKLTRCGSKVSPGYSLQNSCWKKSYSNNRTEVTVNEQPINQALSGMWGIRQYLWEYETWKWPVTDARIYCGCVHITISNSVWPRVRSAKIFPWPREITRYLTVSRVSTMRKTIKN